jgi:hypothetical protein
MIVLGPLVFAFWVYCVVTVLISRDDQVKHLPKIGWLILVLLFPLVGGIAWLLVGRDRGATPRSAHERPAPAFPEYDRPGRAAGATPESDEEFLRRIRERAEEQRRKPREEPPEERFKL